MLKYTDYPVIVMYTLCNKYSIKNFFVKYMFLLLIIFTMSHIFQLQQH